MFGGLELRNPRRRSVSLSAPWGASIPSGSGSPSLYVVASGSATLAFDGASPIVLEHGDLAFLPHGDPHRIASCAGVTIRPVSEYCAERDDYVVGGGGGAGTELRVMCFDVDRTQSRAIMDFAPRTSILRAREVRPWLSHLTRAVQGVLEETVWTPEMVECRLAELFFLEAIAGNVLAPRQEVDEVAFRAAMIIRADLSAKWTANSLARRVGVSRSSFYDRFVRALGCPPSAYLLRARMQEAMVLLRDGASVDQVATSVGYTWASSFTTAFHRYHGIAPSKLKKRVSSF